jgi:hypothetical protein
VKTSYLFAIILLLGAAGVLYGIWSAVAAHRNPPVLVPTNHHVVSSSAID